MRFKKFVVEALKLDHRILYEALSCNPLVNLLIPSTGNSARSQMAEGLFVVAQRPQAQAGGDQGHHEKKRRSSRRGLRKGLDHEVTLSRLMKVKKP
jgi:hypothetical protein